MTSDVYFRDEADRAQFVFCDVLSNKYRVLEIKPGMNITSIDALGAGGGGAGDQLTGGLVGAGGGGGAFARKNVSLNVGDKIAWTAGAGGIGVTLDEVGQPSSVCLANNPFTFLDITGTASSESSAAWWYVRQSFITLVDPIVLYSVSASIFTDATDIGFYAELLLNGIIIASSSVVPSYQVSTDGSFQTEFIFGSVYLAANTRYDVRIFRTQQIQDSTIFGALYVNTYNGVDDRRLWYEFSGLTIDLFSPIDIVMKITAFPASDILVSAAGGSNGLDGAGAQGGAGGLAANSIGDVVFSGGNGANAPSGGGARGGSGGGAGATSSGNGANGTSGSGTTGGNGGSSGPLIGGQISTNGGDGADALAGVDINRNVPGFGGGGGGNGNVGNNAAHVGGDGVVVLNYDGTLNRSNSSMLAMFSPI